MKDKMKEWIVKFDKAAKSFADAFANAKCVDKAAMARDFYDNYYERFEEVWDSDLIYPREGFHVLTMLAQAGFPWAYNDIGEAYLDGKGCDRDPQAALLWIDKALESGMYVSEEIGDAFRLGEKGLPLDFGKAWVCYRSDENNCRFDLSCDCDKEDRSTATMEWWEYVVSRVALTPAICLWMSDCYKDCSERKEEWIQKGVCLCCSDGDKWLGEKHRDVVFSLLTNYLLRHCEAPSQESLTLMQRIVENELRSDGCDNDVELESLLDAFFKVCDSEDCKMAIWERIAADCEAHQKFRHWAGRHRFDSVKKLISRCALCHKEDVECAGIRCPSDILGQSAILHFCSDCYGEMLYKDFEENAVCVGGTF